MKINKLTKILISLSLAIFLFSFGIKVGEYKNGLLSSKQINNRNVDFSLFWQAWDKLEEKFIDKTKLNPQKMFYGAIKGMVASVEDPYTIFLTPEENKETKDDLSGTLEGIGAQLGLKDNRIVVIAPLKNSPAERAGVMAGDIIIKIDNQSTENWTLPFAVSKIRGKKGTKVILTLKREEKELTIEIVRDEIKIPSIELSFEKQTAVLKLNQFGDETTDEWDNAISDIDKKYKKQEIKGMILDLRDNPGGYLQSAVYIASEFLPKGSLIVKQESYDKKTEEYKASRNGKLIQIPLIVLINKGSASASEIVAGALRDYKRAKSVGEKSFGKGSIQEALDLKEGAGLHVTIAKWILPKGDWINHTGVSPDIQVENPAKEGSTPEHQDDLQLEKAFEELYKI